MFILRFFYLKLKFFITGNVWYNITDYIQLDRFRSFEKIIGCKIYNPKYYLKAITHRSYLEGNKNADSSNERLEYLGDAVVDLIVGRYLFNKFPNEDEGYLTKTRSMLVNKSALFDAAKRIKLDDYLLVSENFSKTLPDGSKTVLSDAYESIVGAIFLDKGLQKAEKFLMKSLLAPSFEITDYLKDSNYKSQLLEYTQKKHLENLEYNVIKEEGPQHKKIFTVQVKINNEILGIGNGNNKKSAEQVAAKNALQKIKDA
ncbi:MAG: ribonuclease III [Bacteroidetes bacterium]|nr:ribonuclease III [Bacteroidota bacterium]